MLTAKTLHLTKTDCIKKKGIYFAVQSGAVRNLAKAGQKKTTERIGTGSRDSLKPGKGAVLPGATLSEVQNGHKKKGKGLRELHEIGAVSLVRAKRPGNLPIKGDGDIEVVMPNGGRALGSLCGR